MLVAAFFILPVLPLAVFTAVVDETPASAGAEGNAIALRGAAVSALERRRGGAATCRFPGVAFNRRGIGTRMRCLRRFCISEGRILILGLKRFHRRLLRRCATLFVTGLPVQRLASFIAVKCDLAYGTAQ